jgi:hypothetical protein
MKIPKGWKLVPSRPTRAMLKAMAECYDYTWGYPKDCGVDVDWAKASYRAAMRRAPKSPA